MTHIRIPDELPGPVPLSEPSLGPVERKVFTCFHLVYPLLATLPRVQEAGLLLADQPHLASESKPWT